MRGMQVLVVGRFYTEGFALHIAESLTELGCDVVRFETGISGDGRGGRLAIRWNQARGVVRDLVKNAGLVNSTRRLLASVNGRSLDLALVCHDFLLPQEVERLKEATGAKVALWFPDAISNFTRTYFFNASYDALFFKDPYIVYTLRRTLRRPIFYLPEACNPKWHRPVTLSFEDEKQFGCDIATAGNLYAYRAAFFEELRDYHVRIWGNPPPLWMDARAISPMLQGRYVTHDEKARAFLAAKIVLDNLHPAEIWGINARAFEIAAIGAFGLIDWRPGLADLFVDGEEMVSFRNLDDLRAKLDHYLAHPDERRAIAERGMVRARRDHTYAQRLTVLFASIRGEADGYPLPAIALDN